MTCHVAGCTGFAKRVARIYGLKGGAQQVIHACADHWPKAVG